MTELTIYRSTHQIGGCCGGAPDNGGIPKDWLSAIARRGEIDELCGAFAASLTAR